MFGIKFNAQIALVSRPNAQIHTVRTTATVDEDSLAMEERHAFELAMSNA